MKELHEANITKGIIDEIQNNCRFVQEPNWSKYDTITVDGDYIEIYREPIYKQDPDTWQYVCVEESLRRNFKKDSISGVYVEF